VTGHGGGPQDLHLRPVVLWSSAVPLAIASTLGAIAKGSPMLAVGIVLLVLLAGLVFFLGYKRAGKSRVVVIGISLVLVLVAITATALSDKIGGVIAGSPPQTSTSGTPYSTPLDTTTTTATKTTPPPPPVLPPRPPEEKAILDGTVGEFFDRALTVGSGGTGTYSSSFNFTSGKYGCPSTWISLGQAKVMPGRRGDAPDFFRITLLKAEGNSSTIRVEEMPPEQWPKFTDGSGDISYDTTCPSQYF
jgi:hypothetical protein